MEIWRANKIIFSRKRRFSGKKKSQQVCVCLLTPTHTLRLQNRGQSSKPKIKLEKYHFDNVCFTAYSLLSRWDKATCVHSTTPASQLTNYFLSVWWHKTHHINLIFLVNSVQTKLRDTSETVELRCHYKTIKGNNICKHKLYTWDVMGMSTNYFKLQNKYGRLNNTLNYSPPL